MDLTSRKRKHGKSLTIDIGDVAFVINRSIRQCIFDFETSVCSENRSTAKSLLAEFSLMEIFPNDDMVTSSFLLFLASNQTYSNIANDHGITINGRCRGQATRIMINVREWKLFTVKNLQEAYVTFLAKRARKDDNDNVAKEVKIREFKQLDINVLKRLLGQKGNKDGLLLHITETYEKLREADEQIKVMETDQKELCETIDSLKITIRREQRKLENTKRSISAQKGVITKRLNALDLETSNRDTEWNNSVSKITKQQGYNKMIATKNMNMLEREKNKMKNNVLRTQTSKISLPLLIFDCLKESVTLLNKFKNNKKLRAMLSTFIPLIIPDSSERKEQSHSNHSIGNLLGFNEKSSIAKHYFERSNEIHKLKQISRGELTVKMIEDVLLPLER